MWEEGVLLEDLDVPGASLCPLMDDTAVLKTVSHMARHHAQFWNMPELSSGALGVKPHNHTCVCSGGVEVEWQPSRPPDSGSRLAGCGSSLNPKPVDGM